MKKMLIFLPAIALILLLSACGSSSAGGSSDTAGETLSSSGESSSGSQPEASQSIQSSAAASQPKPEKPPVSSPASQPSASVSGPLSFGDLSSQQQAAYTMEANRIDEEELNTLLRIQQDMTNLKAAVDNLPYQKDTEARQLSADIAALKREKDTKVGEACKNTFGQMNSYAESIAKEYDGYIAAKQAELAGLDAKYIQLQQQYAAQGQALQAEVDAAEAKKQEAMRLLNQKYGIVE